MLLKCNFSFFLPLFHQAPYPSFFCAVLTTGSPSLTSTVRPFLEPVSIPWPKKASFFPRSHLNQPPCKHIIVIKNTVRSILNIKQQLNKINRHLHKTAAYSTESIWRFLFTMTYMLYTALSGAKVLFSYLFLSLITWCACMWAINQERFPWLTGKSQQPGNPKGPDRRKSSILCILWDGAIGHHSDYGSPQYALNSWYVLLYTKYNPHFPF